MRIRLLIAVVAAITLAACGDSPTSPRAAAPKKASLDLICRSGYYIATRDDGTEYCAPGAEQSAAAKTGGTDELP